MCGLHPETASVIRRKQQKRGRKRSTNHLAKLTAIGRSPLQPTLMESVP